MNDSKEPPNQSGTAVCSKIRIYPIAFIWELKILIYVVILRKPQRDKEDWAGIKDYFISLYYSFHQIQILVTYWVKGKNKQFIYYKAA